MRRGVANMSEPTPAGSQRSSDRAAWPWLLLAYALAYGRSMGFGLVWDDQVLAREGAFGGSLGELLLAPQQNLMDAAAIGVRGAEQTYDSYRPLQTLSHAIDLRVLGGSPFVMHAHNLVLGALCVLVAYAVLRQLLASRGAALVCAAVFALHPLQTEPIAYVSARGDLLAGLLALLSLWLASNAGESQIAARRWLLALAAASLYALSLLAKEAYVALPAIVFLLAWARGNLRAQAPTLASYAGGLVTYAALRAVVMGPLGAKVGASPLAAVAQWPGVTLQYVRAFVLPLDSSISRPLDTSLTLFGWAGVASLVIAAAVVLRSAPHRRTLGPLVISGACVLLLLGPATVAAADTGVVADRYAYLAVMPMACFVACAYALVPALRVRTLLRVGAGLWALALLFVHVRQLGTFRDDASLYLHDAVQQPESALAQYRVGYLAARAGDLPRARAQFERAIALDARFVQARNNLGVVLLQMDELEAADEALREAIALAPRLNYRAWYNLAMVQRQRGDFARACDALTRASAINPAYAKAVQARAAMCSDAPAP